jgi:ribonuclease HI
MIESIRYILSLVQAKEKAGSELQFSKVKGHSANIWNDRADALAKEGASRR